jgi:hypothetical protein
MKNKINPHTEYYIVTILLVAVYILLGMILFGILF